MMSILRDLITMLNVDNDFANLGQSLIIIALLRDLRPHVPLSNLLSNDYWGELSHSKVILITESHPKIILITDIIIFSGTPMWKEQSHKSYRPVTVATFR